MDLHEWTVLHVKHKDAFAQKLRDVREDGDTITFEFSDGTLTAHVMEELDVPDVSGKTLVVTLQTKDNVETLVNRWKEFTRYPELTVTFANPGRNEQWSIKPALHGSVAGENIEQGVHSLASSVSYV